MLIGREVHFFQEVDSTNDVAKRLAGLSREGTVVVAVTQTGGKGRIGHRWSSPTGGLWMSVVLWPTIPPESLPLLTLVAGTAVAVSISRLGLDARTKWPNDVVVDGKKVAGILAETGFDGRAVVLGIGVNTNLETKLLPRAFRRRATSLKEELRREVSNHELMRSILRKLDHDYARLQQGSVDGLLQEWRRLSLTIGRRVEVVAAGSVVKGVARDIQDDGSLVVETSYGRVQLARAGECRMVA